MYSTPGKSMTHHVTISRGKYISCCVRPSIDGLVMKLQNVRCSTETETYADFWMQVDVWLYPVVFLITVAHLSIMLFAYADTPMRVISSVTHGVITRHCIVMAPGVLVVI